MLAKLSGTSVAPALPMSPTTEKVSLQPQEKQREMLYRLQAEICRVLGHPRRLAILDLLADGEQSTAELLRALGVSKVNLSQHLSVMRHVGLVVSRQQGRQTFHRLAFPEIKDACRLTREVLAVRLQQTTRLARALHSTTSPAGGSAGGRKGL